MIRLYLAGGVLAAFVALGGYALLERSWRQVATQRAAALQADLDAASVALEAEKANARRAAAVAAEQSRRVQEARRELEATEDRARAIIDDLMREQIERPDSPDCDCSFDDAWRDRLRREIPIRPRARAAPASDGQLRLDTMQ